MHATVAKVVEAFRSTETLLFCLNKVVTITTMSPTESVVFLIPLGQRFVIL